jgi:hypothetical protein
MNVLLSNSLLLAKQGMGVSNYADARAGVISLVGLLAVFVGLMMLWGFMRLLAKFVADKPEAAPVAPAVAASLDPDEVSPEPVAEPEEVLPEVPLTGPLSLPAASLVAAQIALSRYEAGKAVLGQEILVTVNGLSQRVRLLSVGLATTAIVNDRKVVFYRARTVGSAANE